MITQTTATPKLYIGIDVHKRSWHVHMRTDISDHRGFSMPPSPEKLFEYVSSHFPDHEVSAVMEIGCCGFWAAREMLNYGWNAIVVSPGDIKRSDKYRYQKTDSIDSRYLCNELIKGDLRPIHIVDEEREQLRSLLRQRNNVVKLLRTQKNLIKSSLLYYGIDIPEKYDNPNWSKDFRAWLAALKFNYATGRKDLDSKLRILEMAHAEYLQIGNDLRAWCRKHYKKDYYLLKSIPGIGGYLAAAILAELGDLRRFKNERELSNYIGLVPGIYQSGGSEGKSKGITPRCKSLLRSYIIEAAWVALRRNPEYQAYYRKHAGKDTKNIIVKIAHKMVRAMLSIIKNETPFEVNHVQKTTSRSLKL